MSHAARKMLEYGYLPESSRESLILMWNDFMFVISCSVAAGRYSHVSSMGDVHEHVQV